jgi:hypothetical protein
LITTIKAFGETFMQAESIKAQAHQLVDNLPDGATWEDVMYRIYVRQAIDAGLKDSDDGRTVNVKEVRKRFGLST